MQFPDWTFFHRIVWMACCGMQRERVNAFLVNRGYQKATFKTKCFESQVQYFLPPAPNVFYTEQAALAQWLQDLMYKEMFSAR